MTDFDRYTEYVMKFREHLNKDELDEAQNCLDAIRGIDPYSKLVKDGHLYLDFCRAGWVRFSSPAFRKNEPGILKLKQGFLVFQADRKNTGTEYRFSELGMIGCTDTELVFRAKGRLFEQRYRIEQVAPSDWVRLVTDAMNGIYPPFEAGYNDYAGGAAYKLLRKEIQDIIGPEKDILHDDVLDSLIFRGEKIGAIKYYRGITGAGLKEAKEYIDQFF